jgi:hypothetical protein
MGGIGKVFKKVTSIAGKVGGIAGKVANIAGKAVNFLQSPMTAITGGVKKLAGGLLDKLPFGIGKAIKPFAEKLIDSGASFLAKGPLAGLSIFGKALPTIQKIADFASTVKGVADKVGALGNQPAQQNFQELLAHLVGQKVQ